MKRKEIRLMTSDDQADKLERAAEKNIGLPPPDEIPPEQHGPAVFIMITPKSVIAADSEFHSKQDDLTAVLATAVNGALVLDVHEVDREVAAEVGLMYPRLDTRLAPNEYRPALRSLDELSPELLAELKQAAIENGLAADAKPESLRTNRDRVGCEVWAAFWTDRSSKARIGRVRDGMIVWEKSIRPTQGAASC